MFLSYKERLSCLVLKDEFFPIMDEIKGFVGTLTTAGKGMVGLRTHTHVRVCET